MKPVRLIALPLLTALAACGGTDEGAKGERRSAAGEVLGGTISDDMLPLDTVTSQSPPLREKTEAGASSGDAGQSVDAAQPTPGPAPTEPAASSATSEPAPAEEAPDE